MYAYIYIYTHTQVHAYVRTNKQIRTYVLLYTCLKITFLWKLKSKIYHLTTDVNVRQFLSRVDNRLCIFFFFSATRHTRLIYFANWTRSTVFPWVLRSFLWRARVSLATPRHVLLELKKAQTQKRSVVLRYLPCLSGTQQGAGEVNLRHS